MSWKHMDNASPVTSDMVIMIGGYASSRSCSKLNDDEVLLKQSVDHSTICQAPKGHYHSSERFLLKCRHEDKS